MTAAVGLTAVPVSAAAAGTFVLTGSMNTPHPGGSATLLPDGQVLVAGLSLAGRGMIGIRRRVTGPGWLSPSCRRR